jgi:hypothetical protein
VEFILVLRVLQAATRNPGDAGHSVPLIAPPFTVSLLDASGYQELQQQLHDIDSDN